MALARLLAPDDYGLAALALVFASLVLVFSDLALGAAVIQRKNLTEDDRATAFWMSIGAGVVFTALGVALSGPIAALFGQPEVAPLCAVLSLSFLITSLATTHEALLLRDMQFAKLEQRMMLATLVGAVAGIVVGLETRDAWAIIAQQLAQAAASTMLLWALSPWRPSLRFSWASLQGAGGLQQLPRRPPPPLLLPPQRGQHPDRALPGRHRAGRLRAGLQHHARALHADRGAGAEGPRPGVRPHAGRARRIADAWVRAVRLVGALAVPSLLGLMVVAPDFVSVVLGDKWSAAVPLIQVLAIVGIVQSLQSISTDILQARGQANTIFRFSILFTVTHTVGFVVGLAVGRGRRGRRLRGHEHPRGADLHRAHRPLDRQSRPGSWCAACAASSRPAP